MNIRAKLSVQFLFIVSLILLLASLAIYKFSSNYRQENFYNRLSDKVKNIAELLTEADHIDTALLKRTEKDNPTRKINVYNGNNQLVFTTDEQGNFKISKEILDSIRAIKELHYQSGDYEMVGLKFNNKTEQSVIVAGAIDIYGIKKLQNLRDILFLVNGMGLIFVFISGWFFSGQALSPIKNVINQVDKISITKLNLRVDEGNGTDEIALLAKTFNRMLERLESAFKIQKHFIANASHELRTPLTSIIGQLEVNMLKNRTEEEYKATLESVYDDMKNLNLISDRLLLLAQTSSEGRRIDFAPVRIDELLWQTQAELMRHNPDYKIHIDLSSNLTDDAMLTVHGNSQLLKTAFLNLAENGCKYSPDHQVWIKLQPEEVKKVSIQFIDSGIGIKADDLKQIFEPFYRGSNVGALKGHGIGLSLVEKIIMLHNGAIEAQSHPSDKTVFTVSLDTIS